MDEYGDKAREFCEKTGLPIEMKYIGHTKRLDNDTPTAESDITFKREGKKEWSFPYHDSITNSYTLTDGQPFFSYRRRKYPLKEVRMGEVMMTYGERYEEHVNDSYGNEQCSCCIGTAPADVMRELDECQYDQGFDDWLDNEAGYIECAECGVVIDGDTVRDAVMCDDVKCAVCSGDKEKCTECEEVFDLDEMYVNDKDYCKHCGERHYHPEAFEDEEEEAA